MLKHDLLTFSTADAGEIGEAFSGIVDLHRYTCYACAIMPDHVHLLIRKHKHNGDEMIGNIQRASRTELIDAGARQREHPVWGTSGWKVFLDHPDDVRRTIRYIQDNPVKWRLPRQRWEFVREYDGWPLHPGHDPRSPYARRLRQAGRYRC